MKKENSKNNFERINKCESLQVSYKRKATESICYNNIYYTDKKYSINNKFPYESNYYQDYFICIKFKKIKKILDKNDINLNHKKVLIASSGSGIDGHYLKKYYNNIELYFSDIHLSGMEKLRSNFTEEPAVLSDNHQMCFKNNTFDYVFIAASLHHLLEPINGFYELLRVAKYGIIVIEPNDSYLTRIFEKIGWAHEYEIEHNNYVYRFSERDVEKLSKAMFFIFDKVCFFSIHRIAKTKIEFMFLKILNGMANFIASTQGNYIGFIIKKERIIPKCMR